MDRSFKGLAFSDEREFGMGKATRDIVAALKRGEGERCSRQTRQGVFLINEIWIESLGFWVPWDARKIDATLRGYAYPNAIQRERIKRAVKRWRDIRG